MNIEIDGIQITLTKEQLAKIKAELEQNQKQQSAEDFFLEMYNNCQIKFDFSKSKSIFFVKNDNVLFEQDNKNSLLWCDYNEIWSVFKTRYGMNSQQIQAFIQDMLERHFKLGSLTPHCYVDRR